MTDVFGKRGRVWLSELERPRDERETVDGCVRQIDFFNEEVAILEREIAQHALASPDIKRLMTTTGPRSPTAVRRTPAPRRARRSGRPGTCPATVAS